jgi:hypothetical protein
MWSFRNILITMLFIVAIGFLVALIIFGASLNLIYISTVANVVVIILMLATILLTDDATEKQINSLENSTKEQIEYWERRDIIQRKQFINSLIKELNINIQTFDIINARVKEQNYNSSSISIILTSSERSLYNSPTDDEGLNDILLLIYYFLKVNDDRLKTTQMPMNEAYKIEVLKAISIDYESNKKTIDETIELLEKYNEELKFDE